MSQKRMLRERGTIQMMAQIYCQAHHKREKSREQSDQLNEANSSLCPTCQDFLNYALLRLDQCPFRDQKPTCTKCTIHCYQPDRREQVRQIMRFAGPRLLWKRPLLSILHLLDGFKG